MLEAKKTQQNTPAPVLRELADLIDLGSSQKITAVSQSQSSNFIDLNQLLGFSEQIKFKDKYPAHFANEQTA